MLSILKSLLGRKQQNSLLSAILADGSNREEMLGMKAPIIPTPEGIKIDAAKILKYTDGDGYKKFAEEAWSQVIQGIDKILDSRTSKDQRDFYCGEVNATLNLLRLSYKAKYVIEEQAKEQEASSRHYQRG